jgi:CDP-diacylglycerol--glycerol-3-phosphate 3-phosphatidyltransferase
MNLADRITASRILLSPLFFAAFMWGGSLGVDPLVRIGILWILFWVIELSDLLDGKVARSQKTVSSFGKLFDPFADVVARITYFVCFAHAGIMPLWILLVILYREFSILFLRMLLAERGIAMGARPGGKAKAVIYMVSGSASLLLFSLELGGWLPSLAGALGFLVLGLYLLAAILSIGSFIDYAIQYRKLTRS